MQMKDKIIAVGQGDKGNMDNVIDMDLRDVVKKIRGKSGTSVRLTVLRGSERFTLTLKRSKVSLDADAAHSASYDAGDR
jgi:carboxyl-terminal processing protease